MNRFERLTADNPKHLSPLEHPAVALPNHERSGNLMGWRSLRKDMFGEVEAEGFKVIRHHPGEIVGDFKSDPP